MIEGFLKTVDETLNFIYVRGGVTSLSSFGERPWIVRSENLVSQICRGSSRHEVRGFERKFDLNDGEVVFYPSGTVRRSVLCSGGDEIIFRWAHVYFTVFESVDFLSFFEFPFVYDGEAGKKLGDINEKLKDADFDSINGLIAGKALGMQMLGILLEKAAPRKNFDRALDKMTRLSGTFEYIKNNCNRRLTLAELASTANLSPSRFHDVFKSVTGLPPVEFAAGERMKAAQRMLASNDLCISDVAEQLGFPEQFSFSRSFKAHLGISPSEYRTDIRKNFVL